MRNTYTEGEINANNIQTAVDCMANASSFTVKGNSNRIAAITSAVSGIAEASAEQDDSLPDDCWNVEGATGTFHFTIPAA